MLTKLKTVGNDAAYKHYPKSPRYCSGNFTFSLHKTKKDKKDYKKLAQVVLN